MSTGTHTIPFTGARARHNEGWWEWALFLICVLLSVQYYFKVGEEGRSAILRWRPQIQQLFEADIYQRFAYPNPPIMALLLTPLAELPPRAGSLIWFYAKVGMTLLALRWAFRLVVSQGQTFPVWAKILAIVLTLRPIMGDLSHGNVNLFILWLVVGGLYAYRRQWDLTAGIVLSLAIACKVTPVLFVPYFLWKRAWRTLTGCAVGLALFLMVLPGLFLGMSRNLQLLGSWQDCMVKPYVVSALVTTEHPNQSLPGLLYRWFTHGPSFSDKGVPSEYHNVAAVDPHVVQYVIKGCMIAFAALTVWACRTPTQPRHGWRLVAEFGLILLGMLLFSERTWKHHCVTLLVPFTVLAFFLATQPATVRMRLYLVGTLATVGLLMMSTTTGVVEGWNRAGKLAQADGAYVWAYLLLVAALVVLLRQPTSHGVPASKARTPTLSYS
jgi:hypothetical protein